VGYHSTITDDTRTTTDHDEIHRLVSGISDGGSAHRREDQRVLLDLYGTNHGPGWDNPWAFDPARFIKTDPCMVAEFVPQGGGPVDTGHRCSGEGAPTASSP